MKQLDPKAVWLFFLPSFISFAIPLFFIGVTLIGVAISEVSLFPIVALGALGVLALMAISFVWAKLTYRFYKYEMAENGFKKESGIIYKKYVTIPYERIQNVDINRGILARLLGLSDLQIQTAGASASFGRYGATGVFSEGRLPGVSKEVAEQLRDELVNRARGLKSNQGL